MTGAYQLAQLLLMEMRSRGLSAEAGLEPLTTLQMSASLPITSGSHCAGLKFSFSLGFPFYNFLEFLFCGCSCFLDVVSSYFCGVIFWAGRKKAVFFVSSLISVSPFYCWLMPPFFMFLI
jgi:hypothetical protein